jgi:imidazolonepropionase-like amidohydrolase
MTLAVRGVVLPDRIRRDLFVVDGRIRFDPPDRPSTTEWVAHDGWIIPGLVDAHNHLVLASGLPDSAPEADHILASAKRELQAGVLLLREPGSPVPATDIGPEVGLPRTIAAGRFLAPPGGYIPGFATEVRADVLPDAAVRTARSSGGWVKLIGDWPGDTGLLVAHWDPQALATAVRQVHAIGGRVAIHANLPTVIEWAIEAGVDSIEHGTFVGEEHLPAMATRSVAWVPTLVIERPLIGMISHLGEPGPVIAEIADALRRQPSMVRRAVEAGVRVLAGTDAGLVRHGLIVDEIECLIRGGVEPLAALGAASWDARSFLGLTSIEDGGHADLVVYDRDPEADPSVLRTPAAIVLDGRRVA